MRYKGPGKSTPRRDAPLSYYKERRKKRESKPKLIDFIPFLCFLSLIFLILRWILQ